MEVQVKTLKLSQIKLNPDNPRTISDKAIDKLVRSLQDFPDMLKMREVVVDEALMVLGGNMRVLAMKKMGLMDCTVKIAKGLSEDQKREFVIKDNASFGEWNIDALANAWGDLPLADWGVDLPEDWLSPCGGEAKEDDFDADAAAEAIKCPVTKPGEVWALGKHRIMCGDSTKAEDVKMVMGGGNG